MALFRITAPALDLISKRFRQTRVPDAVVYLIEASEPTETPAPLREAILEDEDESRIREISSKIYGNDFDNVRRRLVPAIYPRSQFPKRYVVNVQDIPFVVPPHLSSTLKGCTLDMGEDGLVLTDANGNIVMPRQ